MTDGVNIEINDRGSMNTTVGPDGFGLHWYK